MKQYSVALITLPAESHRSSEECLALGYLKASLNLQVPYVHVECVDAWLDGISLEQLCEKISDLNSLICIGISAYFTSIETFGKIITFIKGKYPTVSIVAGGYGPSFNLRAFLDKGVDYVVIGEGDIVFPLMVDKFCHQQSVECLDGVAFKRNGEIHFTKKGLPVQNLDEIPFADRVHMSYAGAIKNPPHISTSRGCMASCSFCSIASFAKLMGDYTNTRWRQRSISNIVDEIEKIHDETGAVVFKIVDDSFIEPPRDTKWVEEFANEIKKKKHVYPFSYTSES